MHAAPPIPASAKLAGSGTTVVTGMLEINANAAAGSCPGPAGGPAYTYEYVTGTPKLLGPAIVAGESGLKN